MLIYMLNYLYITIVPGKSHPVGVYVPKNGPTPTATFRPKPRPKRKTPQPRLPPRPTPSRPLFSIHLKPNSPLRKLYELTKSKSDKVMKNLSKVHLRDHRIKQKTRMFFIIYIACIFTTVFHF